MGIRIAHLSGRTFIWIDREVGQFAFIIKGWGLELKAPWNRPYFSERNGYRYPLVSVCGWRIFPLRRSK